MKRFHAEPPIGNVSPTTVLGDWYANLLFTKHARLVICVSERSLLPVFVEAKVPSTFVDRFRETATSVLGSLGVTRSAIERELCEMSQVTLGATSNRRVLGSLNELSFLARELLNERAGIDLMQLAVEIAETPCSLIGYDNPRLMTLALMRGGWVNH